MNFIVNLTEMLRRECISHEYLTRRHVIATSWTQTHAHTHTCFNASGFK